MTIATVSGRKTNRTCGPRHSARRVLVSEPATPRVGKVRPTGGRSTAAPLALASPEITSVIASPPVLSRGTSMRRSEPSGAIDARVIRQETREMIMG